MLSSSLIVVSQGDFLSEQPYMAKLAKLANEKKISIEFWAWSRSVTKTAQISDPSNVKYIPVLQGEGKGVFLIFFYLLWMVKVFLKAVLLRGKHKFVCSKFESAFPITLASLIRKLDYVYLDRDSLSMSYQWHFSVRKLIEIVEEIIGQRALLHIVPGVSRIRTDRANIRVISNTPSSSALAIAKNISMNKPAFSNGDFIVYINGWLKNTRGISMMLEAVKMSSNPAIKFLVAGKISEQEAKELIYCDNVIFMGEISNEAALSLYYHCHVVLAFYDPTVEINRKAEPNKWFDCVATNTPFITNVGIDTADFFSRNGSCFLIKYGCSDELSALLGQLYADRKLLFNAKKALSELNIEPWDIRMSTLLDEIISK